MGTMKVFMRVEGFAGSSTEKGREGWSDVRGFTHEMTYPFDMRDNKGRGEPEHGAFLVSKEMDKASPKFYEALAKKKKVDQVVLEFERDTPGAGSTEIYFRIGRTMTMSRQTTYSLSAERVALALVAILAVLIIVHVVAMQLNFNPAFGLRENTAFTTGKSHFLIWTKRKALERGLTRDYSFCLLYCLFTGRVFSWLRTGPGIDGGSGSGWGWDFAFCHWMK